MTCDIVGHTDRWCGVTYTSALTAQRTVKDMTCDIVRPVDRWQMQWFYMYTYANLLTHVQLTDAVVWPVHVGLCTIGLQKCYQTLLGFDKDILHTTVKEISTLTAQSTVKHRIDMWHFWAYVQLTDAAGSQVFRTCWLKHRHTTYNCQIAKYTDSTHYPET